jgi:hypothetical protein
LGGTGPGAAGSGEQAVVGAATLRLREQGLVGVTIEVVGAATPKDAAVVGVGWVLEYPLDGSRLGGGRWRLVGERRGIWLGSCLRVGHRHEHGGFGLGR